MLKSCVFVLFVYCYSDFLPPVVGAMDYDKAVIHCLDCLQNPRLNR